MPGLRDRLKRLAEVESTYPHILSAYFRVREGGRQRIKECKIFLKNRVAEIEHVLSGDGRARQNLAREVAILDRILDQDIPPDVASIALFIKGGEVIERFEANFPFEEQVAYRRVPHVSQLAFMDEELEPFMVVAIDFRSAKIFDIVLGIVTGKTSKISSDVPRRVAAGGWQQMRYQRHIDKQERVYLEDVARQMVELVAKWKYRRIMIVGPDTTTTNLMELLPADVRKRVIERRALDSRATDKDIIDHALTYFRHAESEEEAEKIRRARIEIHSTRMAVAGVENVLRCLAHGQVYEIMLAQDMDETGVECEACGAITGANAHRFSKCPACDAPASSLKDVVLREVMTRRALKMGVKIEFVKDPQFRASLGSAAAFLHSPYA